MASEKYRHWVRIMKRFDKVIAEYEQIIRDANYWNGLPQNQKNTPLDVEQDRVMVHRLKAARDEFVRRNPKPAREG